MFEAWHSATSEMAEAGVLIDCAPLQPPSASTTVRVRDGETLLTDGPAAEIKEHLRWLHPGRVRGPGRGPEMGGPDADRVRGRVEVRPMVQVVAPAEQPAG